MSPQVNPPKLARWLLQKLLREEITEEVLGDLDEKFRRDTSAGTRAKANFRYWYQVLNYLRPFALKTSTDTSSNPLIMFNNYFTVAFRNLSRNKIYSFINIGGLAAGLTVAMLIGLWVYDELTFNEHHENKSSIAQVMRTGETSVDVITTPYLPYALVEELEAKYKETFKQILPTNGVNPIALSKGETVLSRNGMFIGSGAPEVFSIDMVKGGWSALKDPHSIILSETTAQIYFGDEDPMGKMMRLGDSEDVTVTGVYRDLPHNSQFAGCEFMVSFDLLVSLNQWMLTQGFGNNFLMIYVQLEDGITMASATDRIHDIILEHVRGNKEHALVNPQLFAHPMKDWHLRGEFRNGRNDGGLIRFVWLFGTAGVFVLLLACINFMNLSTARSERRAREVGIRKAMGSLRKQLIAQFLSESMLIATIAFMIALAATALSLGWFNQLAAKQIELPVGNWWFWLISLSFIFITGLVAGSYPAFYLSAFQPVKILKGVFAARGDATPRRMLVVVQFTVSVVLVIGTLIVYKQIQFAKNRPVGYERSGLLSVALDGLNRTRIEAIDNELKQTGLVEVTAVSHSPVTSVWSTNGGFEWQGKDPELRMDFATIGISHTYGQTVGWQFVDGRDFNPDLASDSAGFVITESAARIMNFTNPVGEEVNWAPGWRPAKKFHIIGVIKDMIMQSPFAQPMPTVFFIDNRDQWFNIRLSRDADPALAVQKIESVFRKLVPAAPFNYNFVDDNYNAKFQAEERIGNLTGIFAILAVIISCLGLFGLASYTAEQRTKEIGIRKVLGASVPGLWRLMSRDFVLLVVVASVLAAPIAWYLLSNWLQAYTYRTSIDWWIFVAAIGGAIVVTLATVSYQAIKAASANPVKSLRTE